eukprot:TRINITY_DN34055_c0_g1_i1.p1 TRINITY_DN34055_c0_g1~~TRINITY_DN34055_c0_g1_i1.p1  ORF type:complete len:342 (+),score=58.30 TRINITY_DN34055_c0_g1_i1:75-1100(+)
MVADASGQRRILESGWFRSVRYCLLKLPDVSEEKEFTDLVLLLPGAAGRAEHWLPQLQSRHWPPGYCVVAVDYPGSGNARSVSEARAILTTASVSELMWDLVDSLVELGVGSSSLKIHLVGLSFGGMVAQKMAAKQRANGVPAVETLVLLNTYPGLARGTRPFPFFIGGLIWLTICALTLCRLSKASSDLNEAWLRWGPDAWRMQRDIWCGITEMLAGVRASSTHTKGYSWRTSATEWLMRRVGDVSFVLAVLRHGLDDEEFRKLRSVPRRFVVTSGHDWLVRPDNGRRIAVLLQCSEVHFPGLGHILQLEDPELLSTSIAKWCVACRPVAPSVPAADCAI